MSAALFVATSVRRPDRFFLGGKEDLPRRPESTRIVAARKRQNELAEMFSRVIVRGSHGPAVWQGPLVAERRRDHVEVHLSRGLGQGAGLLIGKGVGRAWTRVLPGDEDVFLGGVRTTYRSADGRSTGYFGRRQRVGRTADRRWADLRNE